MAMAEGERTECAEPPRDETPADGALKRAEELKTQANDYFKAKDYENAIKFYSQAIELNPNNAIYYGNRSLAYLRTECYGYALGDATRAIELDKKYIKGYYRRAASNMALGKFRAALRDYETVVKVKPNDKDAKMKYQECSKIVKQKAFERAIAGDEHRRSVVDSLDIESMTIEDEYSGPKLEDGKVTITFMKELMQWYKEQKKLHRKCAYQILVQVKEVLCKLSTLVETTLKETEKITVCGDTHGQFYDLLNIFELNGLPSETNPYIFNGDFVDRGSFSVEVILTLFGFKLLYPDHFHLLRGNHETDNMNQIYGFEGEVKAKYTAQMYELFSEVFEWLPLAQCINGKVLIMHGGLFSEDGVTLDDIRKIERNRQPPDSGRHDSENAERILISLRPQELVDVIKKAYLQEEERENSEVSPREVGHNIYILALQLSRHNKQLQHLLKPVRRIQEEEAEGISSMLSLNNKQLSQMLKSSVPAQEEEEDPLAYYENHTSQIEIVRQDRSMEQIVFPVPGICQFLTEETKHRLFTTTEQDEQGSKVSDFFDQSSFLHNEMEWQRRLRSMPLIYWFSRRMTLWGSISFNLAVFINIIIAFFYPYVEGASTGVLGSPLISLLFWILICFSIAALFTKRYSVRPLIVALILRSIYYLGIGPTLNILGALNLTNKIVFVVSFVGNRGTFIRGYKAMVMDMEFLYHVGYILTSVLGLFAHELFYSILLFDLIYREETLFNVIKSVTRNGRSILLTALLALILVYLFSIVGFLFLKDDFILEVDRLPGNHSRASTLGMPHGAATFVGTCSGDKIDCVSEVSVPELLEEDEEPDNTERACDTLLMCIVTVMNHGLRNGGGVGDILRKPSKDESLFPARVVYDLLFFFIVIIIVLNLIFGVIIDTFADLRSEKQKKEEILKTTCFICGLERDKFDNKTVSFEEHIKLEHNMWNYLYFIVLVRVKNKTDYTGPESYVAQMIKNKNLDWFPRMRAMSLVSSEGEGEQNEIRILQEKLGSTMKLVSHLTAQLNELKEQMTEQRKRRQRLGFVDVQNCMSR